MKRRLALTCGVILISLASGCALTPTDSDALEAEDVMEGESAACTPLDPGDLGCAGSNLVPYVNIKESSTGQVIGLVELRNSTTAGTCNKSRWSRVTSKVGSVSMRAWLEDKNGAKVPCTLDSYTGSQMWSNLSYASPVRACGSMTYWDPSAGKQRYGYACTASK